ncbi:MAG: class I SAM-dependent methyltransferase, partial [Anaerolineales bacterium]|nr:class I SAM-dependent methyltransferase [Anaerolineales bacterium]
GFVVTGLDFSPQMGRQARRRLQRAGLIVPLVRGRVQDLPFTAVAFDTVLSQFPTAFIMEPETLASIARVLKPHGRLVILPEGHLTGGGVVRGALDWLFRVTGQRPGPEVDLTAVWEGFTAVLARAGFTADIHHIPLNGSVATVIIATRQADD